MGQNPISGFSDFWRCPDLDSGPRRSHSVSLAHGFRCYGWISPAPVLEGPSGCHRPPKGSRPILSQGPALDPIFRAPFSMEGTLHRLRGSGYGCLGGATVQPPTCRARNISTGSLSLGTLGLVFSISALAVWWGTKGVWPSLVAQTVKCLPTMRETWVQLLGWEGLLEKEMETHSSILAWKIPWMEEPGRLQSMGSQRVRHDSATSLSLSLSRVFAASHARLLSLNVPSLLEKCGVI